MRILLTLLLINSCFTFLSQEITQKELKGCWEVIRIDNKFFKGGVITYFEFTDQQVLLAKTKDIKNHGVLKSETLVGKYQIENNHLIVENNNSQYKLSFKENELVMQELNSNNKTIQTSYLIKWPKQ